MRELDIRGARALSRRTEDHPDGPLGHDTILGIRAGRYDQPRDRTLKLLAHGLRLDVGVLRDAANIPAAPAGRFELPLRADALPRDARDAILHIIDALLAAQNYAANGTAPNGDSPTGGTGPS